MFEDMMILLVNYVRLYGLEYKILFDKWLKTNFIE